MYSYNELIKKDIVLLPKGKFQADVEDFFEELNILFYIDEYDSKDSMPLTEYGSRKTDNSLIIICSFDNERYKLLLDSYGLQYEKDYIFGTDLIKTVDETETFYIAQNMPGKKVIVMGTGSLCSEMIINNPGLEVEYFIDSDESKHGQMFLNKKIQALDSLKKETAGEFIVIVASSFIKEIKAKLTSLGLSFGDDFYFYERKQQFIRFDKGNFPKLENENIKHITSKKVIVMGTGSICENMILKNFLPNVDYFVDNDKSKHGGMFFNKRIESPDKILTEIKGEFIIIVATSSVLEADRQLKYLGLVSGDDFIFYFPNTNYRIRMKLSEILLKTITDIPRYKLECSYTNKALSVSYFCEPCCCGITVPLGDIRYNSLKNIFKSIYARIIKLSFNNRTYSFCAGCPNTQNTNVMIRDNEIVQRNHISIPNISDIEISLSYDKSCNLSCKSCRLTKVSEPPEDKKEHVELIHHEIIRTLPLLKKKVYNGNGEVFYSKYYREIMLEKNPSDEIFLLTNGILFNRVNWEKIKCKYNSIKISFSVDAATKETYELLRGENFDILLGNLVMASELRAGNEIDFFSIRMVIQRDNFKEIPDFIKLGKSLNVDQILFIRITNWGIYTYEEFLEMDVYNPKNQFHQEFMELLEHPLVRDYNLKYL